MDLISALRTRARSTEEQPALRFLESGDVDGPQQTWSIQELDRRAARIAAALIELDVVGQPVLLVYPPGLDFVAAFLGCLYAGVIAVPVYPPSPADLERAVSRISAIAEDCSARAVLATGLVRQLSAALGALPGRLARCPWIATDELTAPAAPAWEPTLPSDETIAFLQYTSGSTGQPKGVVVRHPELWFNLVACKRAVGYNRHIVTWLPTYHDMGLIGTMLSPLAQGVPVTFMPPHCFLMKPTRWMRAISHFRADCTAGPNFAYHLAARKTRPADLAGLDLSCLHSAVVGAEPVRPEMLADFIATFAPVGLAPEAIYPAFGMAEATLIISTKARHEPPRVQGFDRAALTRGEVVPSNDDAALRLVSCGPSIDGQDLRVADPETLAPLPEGRVGEILVTGPSVARDYWGQPASAAEVFSCAVPGEERRYLRTGDLGFLQAGELFVSGRRKDLIIVRGRNIAPADLEATVEHAVGEWLRPGRVVAVPIPGPDGEAAAILAELRDEPPSEALRGRAEEIARRVAEHHGVPVERVALLPKGAIPLTSSGKVRRSAARDLLLDGSLPILLSFTPGAPAPAAPIYRSLDHIRRKLDTRDLSYRFDLEADLPWDQRDAPGLLIPTSLLQLFGIDPGPLCRSKEVFETFQWAAGLSICRTFELVEWGIIQFARQQAAQLGDTESIARLWTEEDKHIQLFRRLGAALAQQRPALLPRFEAVFRDGFAFLRGLFSGAAGAELHLRIWLATLFFEPASLHLAEELLASEEPIQPLWRRAHAVHAQEELQHVGTASGYLAALQIDPAARAAVVAAFTEDLRRGFRVLYGLDAPVRLVHALWPELGLGEGEAGVPGRFLEEVLHAPSFQSLRRVMPDLAALRPEAPPAPAQPPPEVVFVLSSERSGSTLLRVMLSAHPRLFAPPELNLINYPTLGERAARLPQVQQGGLAVALSALGVPAEQAAALVTALVEKDAPTEEAYALLAGHLQGRVLVDKSPIYSRDLAGLRRAEALFGGRARYIHLSRHPYPVIESYARIGLERLVAERLGQGADAEQLGEMGWTLSYRTIQGFLAEVDPARQTHLRFEDLVADPGAEMTRLCAFLGLPYSPRVVEPYRHGEMIGRTDERTALGDPRFQEHRGIDPALGEVWRHLRPRRPLSAEARRMAQELGYAVDGPAATADPAAAPDASDAAAAAGKIASLRAVLIEGILARTGLPIDALTDDRAFGDLGLDSLALIELTNDLEARLGHALPAMTLYDHPTIGRLAAHLSGEAAPGPAGARATPPVEIVDLSAEVTLDPEIAGNGAAPPPRPDDELLLTGATGFLGAYLLRDLLRSTSGSLWCLVRASSVAEGWQRIEDNLARYGLLEPEQRRRIIVLPGDLSQPRLGLDPGTFAALAQRIDAIVHNGALLRFGQSYGALAPSNVEGTREVLRLAVQVRPKSVHYVSSVAVFDTLGHRDGEVDEASSVESWDGLGLGYSQTKWVAERLVALAAARGVPVTIYRSGAIGGDSDTGAWNTQDLICRLIKACVLQRSVPRLSFELDLAPVDYVSRALVSLARSQPAGGLFHLDNPQTTSWATLADFMRGWGYPLKEVPYGDWVAELREDARRVDHPLAALLPLFVLPQPPDGLTQIEARQHRPQVRSAATAAALSPLGVSCPAIDAALLRRWFERLCSDGFLSRP